MKTFKKIVFAVLLLAAIGIIWYIVVQVRGGLEPKVESDYRLELADIPEWSGEPSVELNDNIPSFSDDEIKKECFIQYSELDSLGRCGAATACLGEELFPEGERESIGMVKPSGWQSDKYSFIDNGGFLYNRCHMLAWMLTGENEEPRNLITGTRYMNTEGMLKYESLITGYIYRTENHVMYRVTPVFYGDELVARGVQLEAYSVEDKGVDLSFNVFCFNVQPGVTIDYATGENRIAE